MICDGVWLGVWPASEWVWKSLLAIVPGCGGGEWPLRALCLGTGSGQLLRMFLVNARVCSSGSARVFVR